MKERLLIIGAGGHGKVVADIAQKMNKWKEISFLDDDTSKKTCVGLDIIGTIYEAHLFYKDYDFFIAVGNNSVREAFQTKFESEYLSIEKLIHPSAVIGAGVEIGIGSVVMAGAIINSCTIIGRGCIVNTGATVDHDSCIEDFVHISPGVNIAGDVTIGRGTWIGIGSSISNSVNITRNCIIGAGGVVIRNITTSGTYVGSPVRKLC